MATGMIRQTFHHPRTNATAVLEYPAGWSRACYYTITLSQPGMKDRSDRHECDSPQEARAGAMDHQRLALADGWLMGAAPEMQVDRSAVTLYRNGERIECEVIRCDLNMRERPLGSGRPGHYVIEVVCHNAPAAIGDRLVIRREFRTVRSQWAMQVNRMSMCGHAGPAWCLMGPVVETQPTDAVDIDREAVIQRCADMPDMPEMPEMPEMVANDDIWNALAEAFPDAAARQDAMHRVVMIRQQRRDAAARAAAAAREQQRRELVAAVAQVHSPMPRRAQTIPVIDEDAIRRLAGGQMPGEKKRRRINLGE